MNGSFLIRMLLVAVMAVSCTLLLKGKTPALAILISLTAVLALTGLLLPKIQAVWQGYQGLLTETGLDYDLFVPVIKVFAVAQVTHLSAELCRDAGERAVAAKLELCGAAVSILCVMPLAQRALALIGALGT